MNQCNEHLQVKLFGQRDSPWNTLGHTIASTMRYFLCFGVSVCFLFVCVLFCGDVAKANKEQKGKIGRKGRGGTGMMKAFPVLHRHLTLTKPSSE